MRARPTDMPDAPDAVPVPAIGGDALTVTPSADPAQRRRLIETAEGTSGERFSPSDWVLLLIPATIWGSSFLLIAIGLESLSPTTITWLRLSFGFLALATLPASRRVRVDRDDRARVALVGLVWMAFPMSMFPLAEQWIDSSVTGMLNGALPLFSAAIAALLLRRPPGRPQQLGLAIGFAGVVLVSLPSLRGTSGTALGATLVVVAMLSYGLATNLVVPLQQKYGSLPIIWRAQAVAVALTAPLGIAGLPSSSWEWKPVLAVVVLGAFGTGFAFIAATNLMGRVGATRGSVLAYLIPVVAVLLGVIVRHEGVALISLVGTAFVLAGAWVTTRAGR